MAKGAPVDALLGLNTEGEAVLEAEYRHLAMPGAFGLGIHRSNLFGVLYDAVQAAGIAVATGHEVAGTALEGEARRLVFADGSAITALRSGDRCGGPWFSPCSQTCRWLPYGALWATIDWPASGPFQPRLLEQRYARAQQMVGLLPVGEGRAAFFGR